MPRWTQLRFIVYLVILIGIFIVPTLVRDPYYLHILIMIGINCMFALSWRLIMRAGQLSFGHAAFIGIGAYACALAATRLGLPFWLALPLAGVAAAIIALPFGSAILRLRGMYFAICTWAFAEIMATVYLVAKEPFQGADGIALPTPAIGSIAFVTRTPYYYLTFVLLLITVAVLYRMDRSRLGMRINAMREADILAESVGINLMRYKTLAFTIACFFAGMAGGLYAYYLSFIAPYTFGVHLSIDCLVYAMVGGLGNIYGPLIGATLLTFIPTLLHATGFFKTMIFGAILVIVVIFLPDGLISLPQKFSSMRARLRGKEVGEENAPAT